MPPLAFKSGRFCLFKTQLIEMEKLFKWASSTFALLPGVAIIVTNLGTPPGISKVLLGGIIEACGAFTLLTLNHRKVALSKIDQRKRKRAAITFFILFF